MIIVGFNQSDGLPVFWAKIHVISMEFVAWDRIRSLVGHDLKMGDEGRLYSQATNLQVISYITYRSI